MMNTKNLKKCDICLIKLSSMAFILFLITVWPSAMNLVHNIHWSWFLIAMVIFAIKPMMNCCKK